MVNAFILLPLPLPLPFAFAFAFASFVLSCFRAFNGRMPMLLT
jgi:hypothetical protein